MTKRLLLLLSSLLLLLAGCYRPAKMDMAPIFRPWQTPRQAAPKAQSGHQPTTGPGVTPRLSTLSPKQLVHHVLRSNLRLRWLRRQNALQRANAKGFDLVENPEIRVMGLSGALANGNINQLGIRLRWAPPFPTVQAATVDRNKALALAESQQLWIETYALLANARKLYAEALLLSRQKTLLSSRLKLKRQQWKWEQTRRKAGVSTTLQVAAQRMAYVQQQLQRQQLSQRRQSRLRKLRALLGVEGDCAPAPSKGFLASHARRPSRQKAIQGALQRAPGLAIIRYRYRAHKAALWIETTKRIPWFSFFQLSYEFGESSWPYGFFLGMGVQLPLFNWNTARIQQQRRTLKALQAQARIQVSQIVQRLIGSHKRWRQAQQQHTQAKALLQKHVTQSLALLKRTPQAGVPPLQRWRLQESILQLQEHLAQQATQLQLAAIALDRDSYTPIWKRFGLQAPK